MMGTENFNRALLGAFDDYADRDCFKLKRDSLYHDYTYSQVKESAFLIAHFLQATRKPKGERIAIIAENSPELMAAYLATLFSGHVLVPLSPTLPINMLRSILNDSRASIAILQDHKLSEELGTDSEGLKGLERIIVVNQSDMPIKEVTPLKSILSYSITEKESKNIRTMAEEIDPSALAIIFYVGKETDKPMGAMFHHAQIRRIMEDMARWFILEDDDMAFTVLNWSYVPSFKAALHYLLSGVTNTLAESADTVFENLQEASPTVVLTIPFALENIYNKVMTEFSQFQGSRRSILQWALTTSKEYRAAGLTASDELRERYQRADMTFFSQIRGLLGGRLRRIYLAGAYLSDRLVDFAEAIGLSIFNVYHLTETGGFPAVSMLGAERPGSCGQIAPGFQIRIADDNEVLVRGETVMHGYWKNAKDTSKVIDSDGWLHTGDLGHFDSDGYLYLTGYKQSVIKLSKGLKIMPNTIEKALLSSPIIHQAVVFGEGRPYVSALLVPNYEALKAQLPAKDDGEKKMSTRYHPGINSFLDEVVADVNSKLNSWERIEAYSILDQPFSEENGELTPSKKINRQVVSDRYAVHVQAMYPMTFQLEEQAVTEVQLEPEQLRELLEKQDILNAWIKDAGIDFLFELARAKQIDIPSMVHICDTVAAIAQMQSEEKPLSTALIVGDSSRVSHVLPESEIQLQRYDHIRSMRQIVIALARLVDGIVFAYGVDKHGYVRKIHKLEIDLDNPTSFLLGPQFSHHAALSEKCDSVVFLVPVGGRQVRVFANGQLVGRYTDGNWYSESISHLEEFVARLAEQKQIGLILLKRILRCAFQMSEENLGAIFVLGDSEAILRRSDSPSISAYATLLNTSIDTITDRELINFAKQDGATIIDINKSLFSGCMVLLRPGADTQAEIGLGRGARHSSAAKMSAEANCIAITVSQDGPITVYDNGQRIMSL